MRISILSIIILSSMNMFAQTSYKDVAHVFIKNCTACHHDGGIQFSLTKYNEVVSNAFTIKNAINAGEMPPWPADPTYKHYVNERVINAADKTLLLDWIDNGTLAGDTSLAPPVPTYGQAQLIGTPDLILNVPKFTSTANTNDHYYCLNVPVNNTQDRYIRAFEFIPGNASIIHHAVITIDTTGTAVDDLSGNCYNFQGQINIGDFAPGMGPTVLPGVPPAKFGFKLKAGSTMSFQIHVPEGTNGMKDSSQLRLFFYPLNEPNIRPMFFETVLQNWTFNVPANSVVKVNAKYPNNVAGIPIDVSLYGSFPHSHTTCTSIINYAYQGSDTIPLIKIPHWDFHWQGQYTFPNLVKFPQGYHLRGEHVFDNTIINPHTPNPNVAVSPGYFTEDEMFFDSFLYTNYIAGDENIDIAALLANDTLLNPTSTITFEQLKSSVSVYPNPFIDEINFEYSLASAQYVQLKIFDLSGREITKLASRIETSGFHVLQWNGMNATGLKMPSGNYIYQLSVGKEMVSGIVSIR